MRIVSVQGKLPLGGTEPVVIGARGSDYIVLFNADADKPHKISAAEAEQLISAIIRQPLSLSEFVAWMIEEGSFLRF